MLLVDDHPLVVEAMSHWLHRLEDGLELQALPDCESALALAASGVDIDLVLLDLNLPGLSGLPALKAWRSRFPAVPVVVLSGEQGRQTVQSALEAGASGFVPKSSSGELLLGALRVVLAGGRYLPPQLLATPGAASAPAPVPAALARLGLTERQLEVLRLVARGAPNKTICRELGLAERTVKSHVTAVLRALKVSSRTQAAVAAAQWGLHEC